MHNICEKLFRAVADKAEIPNYWKEDSITSAVFKDSKGVSVNRQGCREEQVALNHSIEQWLKKRFIFSVLKKTCNECNCFIKPDPTEDNDYHSLILRSEEVVTLTSSQARGLAKSATQEFAPHFLISYQA